MSFAITDRIAQYQQHNEILKRMQGTTKKEVLETWYSEVEAWALKVKQQKERLEALGVKFDG